jgi:hypothetical protein
VTFGVQDIKKPWPEADNDKFDLVHQRLTLLGAGPNPSASIAHLYSIVKPGGWIQISEGTFDFPPNTVSEEQTPAFNDMLKLMRAIAEMVGAEWHLGNILKGLLEEAGFADVSEEDVILNMGQTNKDENLAKEGAETCSIAVKGLSKFAQSKFPMPSSVLADHGGVTLLKNRIHRPSTRETTPTKGAIRDPPSGFGGGACRERSCVPTESCLGPEARVSA